MKDPKSIPEINLQKKQFFFNFYYYKLKIFFNGDPFLKIDLLNENIVDIHENILYKKLKHSSTSHIIDI